MHEIKTSRLTLRRPSQNDLDDLLALDNDPEVMRWINGGLPVSKDEYVAQLLPQFLDYDDTNLLGFWIAESEQFIGWVSLRGSSDKAELGFRLCRAAWGKGYATEIAQALLVRIDGSMLVYANTYEENIASQKALARLGFVESRRYRLEADQLSDSSVHDGEMWDGDDIEFIWQRSGD